METRPRTNPAPHFFNVAALTVVHCFRWVASSCNTKILENPNYHPKKNEPPIALFCVHGTADRSSAFQVPIERLLPQTPSIKEAHLLAFDFRGQGLSIPEFTAQLNTTITLSGYKVIYLAGHSRGAEIVSYWALHYAHLAGIEVREVEAIAGPYGGSNKAIFPFTLSKSVAQMEIGSSFGQQLCNDIKLSHISHAYYAAEKDGIVDVTAACPSGEEAKLKIYRGHNHLSLLYSWKMIEDLRKRINGEDCSLSLMTAKTDIGIYIEEFNNTFHFFSGTFKTDLLNLLIFFLDDLIHNMSNDRYPEAKSIGDFIKFFLLDKSLLKSGASVLEALNSSLTFFQFSNTSTVNFLEGLCLRYKNVEIPNRIDVDRECTNETQIQLRNA